MSEKRTETSTGGQDMGPFKAGAPFKFTDVQSLQLAIEAYFSARPISDLLAGPDGRKIGPGAPSTESGEYKQAKLQTY